MRICCEKLAHFAHATTRGCVRIGQKSSMQAAEFERPLPRPVSGCGSAARARRRSWRGHDIACRSFWRLASRVARPNRRHPPVSWRCRSRARTWPSSRTKTRAAEDMRNSRRHDRQIRRRKPPRDYNSATTWPIPSAWLPAETEFNSSRSIPMAIQETMARGSRHSWRSASARFPIISTTIIMLSCMIITNSTSTVDKRV
jgi:hypothetical protein